MGVPPAVLILDDGELDDVQQLLQELAIPFARIRGGAIVQVRLWKLPSHTRPRGG